MKATTMIAQCTRVSPNRVMSVVAMRAAAPDSAIILPSIVPSATTIAMNPRTVPTPSWNAFTTAPNGMPATIPRARETVIKATKGCSLNRAIRTISVTTAADARSSSCAFALTPHVSRGRRRSRPAIRGYRMSKPVITVQNLGKAYYLGQTLDRHATFRDSIMSFGKGVATRLKQNGDDVEGWLRLVRAYVVLGERDKARQALADARQAVGGDAGRLRELNDGLKNLGLDG